MSHAQSLLRSILESGVFSLECKKSLEVEMSPYLNVGNSKTAFARVSKNDNGGVLLGCGHDDHASVMVSLDRTTNIVRMMNPTHCYSSSLSVSFNSRHVSCPRDALPSMTWGESDVSISRPFHTILNRLRGWCCCRPATHKKLHFFVNVEDRSRCRLAVVAIAHCDDGDPQSLENAE